MTSDVVGQPPSSPHTGGGGTPTWQGPVTYPPPSGNASISTAGGGVVHQQFQGDTLMDTQDGAADIATSPANRAYMHQESSSDRRQQQQYAPNQQEVGGTMLAAHTGYCCLADTGCLGDKYHQLNCY